MALGTNGWIRLTFPFAHGRPTPCRVEVGDTTSAGAYPTSTHEFPPLNQYQLQADRFSRFVLGQQVPAGPLEDARDTARTINALFASARNGTGTPWPNDKTPGSIAVDHTQTMTRLALAGARSRN